MVNAETTKLWKLKSGQNFINVPLEIDWRYTATRNKAGLIDFKSPNYISSGTEIRLTGNFPDIGGIIVKVEQSGASNVPDDLYKYTAVDYKTYLLGEINYTSKKNVRAHQVINAIKKNVPELQWSVGKTSRKYKNKLVWKKKTVLQIINELIWLEWKYAKKLIYFNVDANRKLTFKYYPAQIKGYSFYQAHKYKNSYDASQIKTGYKVIDANGKLVASFSDPSLTAKYGHLFTIIQADKEDTKD